jgi:hypothetical protein
MSLTKTQAIANNTEYSIDGPILRLMWKALIIAFNEGTT